MIVREKVLKALEEKREKKEIGNSLEAEVELSLSKKADAEFLAGFKEDLAGLFLVSRVGIRTDETLSPDGRVEVKRAGGTKCERCWIWRDTVGKDKEHPTLCHRCVQVLRGV